MIRSIIKTLHAELKALRTSTPSPEASTAEQWALQEADDVGAMLGHIASLTAVAADAARHHRRAAAGAQESNL